MYTPRSLRPINLLLLHMGDLLNTPSLSLYLLLCHLINMSYPIIVSLSPSYVMSLMVNSTRANVARFANVANIPTLNIVLSYIILSYKPSKGRRAKWSRPSQQIKWLTLSLGGSLPHTSKNDHKHEKLNSGMGMLPPGDSSDHCQGRDKSQYQERYPVLRWYVVYLILYRMTRHKMLSLAHQTISVMFWMVIDFPKMHLICFTP